jgi:membrane protein implicated in regulation of membrane protease activity
MKRFAVLVVCVSVIAVAAVGCREKQPKPSAREVQLSALRGKLSEMRASLDTLDQQVAQAKQQQEQLLAHYGETQNAINAMRRQADESQQALEALTRAEMAETQRRTGGWPWYLTLLLIVALIVIFYLIFKRITRDESVEEDEAADEGFVEETDMGTIRYPGTSKPESSQKEE